MHGVVADEQIGRTDPAMDVAAGGRVDAHPDCDGAALVGHDNPLQNDRQVSDIPAVDRVGQFIDLEIVGERHPHVN